MQHWGIICPGCAPGDCTNNVQQLSNFSSRKDDLSVAYRTIELFGLEGTLIVHLVQLPAMSRQLQLNQVAQNPILKVYELPELKSRTAELVLRAAVPGPGLSSEDPGEQDTAKEHYSVNSTRDPASRGRNN